MGRKLLRKYLILAGVLLVFAGAMWLLGRGREIHQENAVLARIETSIDVQKWDISWKEAAGKAESVAAV